MTARTALRQWQSCVADELYQSSSRNRYASGTGAGSYISRASASAADRNTDTFSRRYNYRSRSDIGPGGLATPRRYASQTLLDGSRPGPTTPHWRRDALESLQRELDTLSRSPTTTAAGDRATPTARGYASDTGYLNDTIRSRTGAVVGQGISNYDYGRRLRRTHVGDAADRYVVTRLATTTEMGSGVDGASVERVVDLK